MKLKELPTLKLEDNFQNYLNNTDLVPECHTDFGSNGYQIVFNKDVSQEQQGRILEFLHIKPEIGVSTECADVKPVSSTNYVAWKGNILYISIPRFRIFYNIYELLKSFGVKIIGATISESSVTYEFKTLGRTVLNSKELDAIQNEVNPDIDEHDSCRQFGFNSTYTIHIRIH